MAMLCKYKQITLLSLAAPSNYANIMQISFQRFPNSILYDGIYVQLKLSHTSGYILPHR